MDVLRRWRQPVAVILLVASGVRLLAGVLAVPVLASSDAWGSVATAALILGRYAADPLLLVATAAAAAWCLTSPPTAGARTIAAVAVVELLAAVLVSLVFGLMGLTSDAVGRGIEFVQLLAALSVPALAAVLLLALLRAVPAGSTAGASAEPPPELAQPAVMPGPAPPPPALPPSWQPDQATGMVWQTAGEAAAGAPPTGWPAAGESTGWQPIPGSPEQPGPPRPPLN